MELKQEAATLYLRENYTLSLPNARIASDLLNLLREIRESEATQRHRKIKRFYEFHFSHHRTARLVRRAKLITQLLRFNGLLLTLLFFGAIPASYIVRKETTFPYVLLATLIFVIYQAMVTFFTVKRLHPTDRKQRWVVGLSALFPWQGMQAGQQLLSQCLPLQHPLAVSAALSNRETFVDHLKSYWRTINYSQEAPPPEPFMNALKQFMKRHDISPDSLLAPPVSSGNDTASYCPCCHAQYRKDFTTCSDCQGVELIPFENS